MKIAAKLSVTALATVLSLGLASMACAQDVVAPAPAPAPAPAAPAAAPGPSSTQVSSSVKEALDSISVPSAPTPAGKKDKAEKMEEEGADADLGLPESSTKVPKSVKTVVNKLNDTTENVTLENLNAAREAVVKLDVLIDIEKRLNDLAKLRRERDGGSGISVDASMPMPSASDIGGAALPAVQPVHMAIPSAPIVPPTTDYDVVQVMGVAGKFTAQVKDPGGSMQVVHVGDELSDGSKVVGISRQGVTVVRKNKSKKTFELKNAPTIYTSSR